MCRGPGAAQQPPGPQSLRDGQGAATSSVREKMLRVAAMHGSTGAAAARHLSPSGGGITGMQHNWLAPQQECLHALQRPAPPRSAPGVHSAAGTLSSPSNASINTRSYSCCCCLPACPCCCCRCSRKKAAASAQCRRRLGRWAGRPMACVAAATTAGSSSTASMSASNKQGEVLSLLASAACGGRNNSWI